MSNAQIHAVVFGFAITYNNSILLLQEDNQDQLYYFPVCSPKIEANEQYSIKPSIVETLKRYIQENCIETMENLGSFPIDTKFFLSLYNINLKSFSEKSNKLLKPIRTDLVREDLIHPAHVHLLRIFLRWKDLGIKPV